MRTFFFISIPLHSFNSSIGLLYKILTLIPLIPTHSFLHSQPIPRIFALIPSIHPLIPRIPIIPLIPFPDSQFQLLQIAAMMQCFKVLVMIL